MVGDPQAYAIARSGNIIDQRHQGIAHLQELWLLKGKPTYSLKSNGIVYHDAIGTWTW